MPDMTGLTYHDIAETVRKHGGTVTPSINWIWAHFPDDEKGKTCFELVKPFVDHRGYYDAQPDAGNPNLHQGGFRYRL